LKKKKELSAKTPFDIIPVQNESSGFEGWNNMYDNEIDKLSYSKDLHMLDNFRDNTLELPQFDQNGIFFEILMRSNADIGTAQEIIEKQIVRTYDDKLDDETSLWFMYNDFVRYLKEKGLKLKDILFPPNSSSLVNNIRKSILAWRNCTFYRIDTEIYSNCCFLEKFDPSLLFNFSGILPNLAVVLSAFCEFPDRIKKMFLTTEVNIEGAYLGRVFHKGWWKPV